MLKFKCLICNKNKESDCFAPNECNETGYSVFCNPCVLAADQRKEIDPFIKGVYRTQLASSKRRGHRKPYYSRDTFIAWFKAQPNFQVLWNDYVASGYDREMAPSADRLDSLKPYSLNNIRLTTCALNKAAFKEEKKTKRFRDHKPVNAYDKDGTLVYSFRSGKAACDELGYSYSGIQACASKRPVKDGKGYEYVPKTYKGLVWRWAA